MEGFQHHQVQRPLKYLRLLVPIAPPLDIPKKVLHLLFNVHRNNLDRETHFSSVLVKDHDAGISPPRQSSSRLGWKSDSEWLTAKAEITIK
jgi:hypothetical protein